MVSSPPESIGNAESTGCSNVGNAPEGQGKTGINRCS